MGRSLGELYSASPVVDGIISYSCLGSGLRFLARDDEFNSSLMEVITYFGNTSYCGVYGRFIILITLGIGCTVWYKFAAGSPERPYNINEFPLFNSFEPFKNHSYETPGYFKINFAEHDNLTEFVTETMTSEIPFNNIYIPASGPLQKAVSIGLLVAVFLATGDLPTGSVKIIRECTQ